MENQINKESKKKRGRKEIPPNKRKKGITCVFSPEMFKELDKEIEKGLAESRGQRIVQIVEKYFRELKERNPPW